MNGMPSISDALKTLHIEKELFAKLYEKIVGKSFSNKTTIVSDANLEKIQSFVDKLPKNFTT
jgi:hypothetical protein